MIAIPPISQAPSGSDAAQLNASASAESPPSRGAKRDFAGALRDAGGKPARRSAVSKQQDANLSGSTLPVPGNPPPPGNQPLPVSASPSALTASSPPPAGKTDLLAAAQAAAGAGAAPGAVTGAPGGAAGADPNAIPAAPTLTASAGSTAALAPNFDLAAAPASAPGGDAPGAAGNGNSANAPGSAANGPAVPGSGLSVPLAPSIRTLASAATSNATPAAAQGSAPGAKSGDGLQSQGAIAPASSQTPSNGVIDPTLNGPAATAAPVQAVMAAAIVQGTSGPSADTVLQGVAAARDAPAGAPAAALAQAATATSAAVTAATAGRIAQEVSSAAGAGTADKRSHANSPDLSLAGASNDGSAGAAQLLTSNTPTDSSPSPTFKVAAGVDTAGFGQGVADKVSVMMDGNLTSAKLQVNPPALGPIEVRIALQGGHAQVWLSSHSAVTRDALESSSPKLREMLGSQGFSQVSVDISHRSFQDRSPPSQAYEAMPSIEGVAPVLAQASASISRSAIGLLDAYA
jgi:flagellar hook-length control protein FliK